MYEVTIAKDVDFRGMSYRVGERRVINGSTFERFRKFGIVTEWNELNPKDLSEYEGRESGPCVVIGGGPSLRNFDWKVLKRWACIACNMAVRYVPWARYMISMDFTPILEDPEKLDTVQSFKGQVFVKYDGGKIHPESRQFNVLEDVSPDYVAESFTEGVNAMHSGQAAAQIGMFLGYNPIYLLGIDCKMGPRELPFHHYDDGLEYEYDYNRMAQWAAAFNAQMPTFAKRGVDICNITPDSDLRAYRYQHWEEVLLDV